MGRKWLVMRKWRLIKMSKKMLLYIPSFSAGGAERVASVLVNRWAKSDEYDLLVVNTTPKEGDFFVVDGSVKREFLHFDYSKGGLGGISERVRRVLLLRRCLRRNADRVVVSFLAEPSLLVLVAAIGLRNRIICCEHTNYFGLTGGFRRFLRNVLYWWVADGVTVLTERDIQNYPSTIRKKISVLENPIGVEPEYEVDLSMAPSGGDVRLLFVGRLVQSKGIDRLCQVISRLKSDNWTLDVCGDGVWRSYLKRFVDENGLQHKIFLHGNVARMERFYERSDVLLMTSYWEGLPMVIPEAMAFGVPVVAFDCPTGPRELIKSEANGFLVKDGDIPEFVERLDEIICCFARRLELSRNAVQSVDRLRIANVLKNWNGLLSGPRD